VSNISPTLTEVLLDDYFDHLDAGTEIALPFWRLSANSDASDVDGSVESLVVTGLTSGSLRIGSNAATATAWDAIVNNVIDATHTAYWTSDAAVSGVHAAFEVQARDDLLATSAEPVPVRLGVHVNLAPQIDAVQPLVFNPHAVGQSEMALDTLYIYLFGVAASDPDGEIAAWDVVAAHGGMLRIGADVATAAPWDPVNNHLIDPTHIAFLSRPEGAAGPLTELTLRAVDDHGAVSPTTATLAVVTQLGVRPEMSSMSGPVAQVHSGREVELAAPMLAARSDATDADGRIDAFQVTDVRSGVLRIGFDQEDAKPWDAVTNHLFGGASMKRAFWTPDEGVLGLQAAFSVVARDNLQNSSDQVVNVTVEVLAAAPEAPVVFGGIAMHLFEHALHDEAPFEPDHFRANHVMVDDPVLNRRDGGQGNFDGASVRVELIGGTLSIQDVWGVGDLWAVASEVYLLGHGVVGTASVDGAGVKLTFNANATQALVNEVISNLAFDASLTALGSRTLQWTYDSGVPGAAPIHAQSTLPARITPALLLAGTVRSDVLTVATAQDGWLRGDLGDDTLVGGDLDDRLEGGLGKDLMKGGAGNDVYVVDTASDRLQEAADGGVDTVLTSAFLKSLNLADNIERLLVDSRAPRFTGKGNGLANDMAVASVDVKVSFDGGAGNDRLVGGRLDDLLVGGEGDDTLLGGQGHDQLKGGAGHDWIGAGEGYDKIDGADGSDTIFAGNGANDVKGGLGDDVIAAGTGHDKLDGGDGNDTIFASEGLNAIKGGLGDDIVYAGQDDDKVDGGDGHDTVVAGDGWNSIKGGNGNDHITAGNGNDTIDGGEGNDYIDAGYGANAVKGGGGDDFLMAGFGGGKLDGGKGNDVLKALADTTLIGGAGFDVFRFDSVPVAGHLNTIKDFNPLEDTIELDHLVFADVGSVGPLLAAAFTLSGQATTAEHRIVVNAAAHTVSYDADGSGVLPAVVMANVLGNLNRITELDFQII
jgi:Ca2+-binding RTX toxin-like protein